MVMTLMIPQVRKHLLSGSMERDVEGHWLLQIDAINTIDPRQSTKLHWLQCNLVDCQRGVIGKIHS